MHERCSLDASIIIVKVKLDIIHEMNIVIIWRNQWGEHKEEQIYQFDLKHQTDSIGASTPQMSGVLSKISWWKRALFRTY